MSIYELLIEASDLKNNNEYRHGAAPHSQIYGYFYCTQSLWVCTHRSKNDPKIRFLMFFLGFWTPLSIHAFILAVSNAWQGS